MVNWCLNATSSVKFVANAGCGVNALSGLQKHADSIYCRINVDTVEANAHNAGGCPASNAIHGHINDFLVRTGLRSGVSELQLPCFTAVRAEIALMSGGAFAVTHHPVSS